MLPPTANILERRPRSRWMAGFVAAAGVTCLLGFQQASSLSPGEAWSIERSTRYLDEASGVDYTNMERTDYRVEMVDARGMTISQTRKITGLLNGKSGASVPEGAFPRQSILRFGPGGAPSYAEDSVDLASARVDRVQWAAAEERKGVSWTRRFPATSTLPGAKLTMRPTSTSPDGRTIAVTYVEDGGKVNGEATVVVSEPKRIVNSLKMTLTGIVPTGKDKPLKVAVNQTLVKK